MRNSTSLYVDIPRALKTRIRLACAHGEISISDFVRGALEAALRAVERPEHDTP